MKLGRTPSYVDYARKALSRTQSKLIEDIAPEDFEETAFPVYANSLGPAAYLGWSRVRHAQCLLETRPGPSRVLDFGSGLGVMLPFLAQAFEQVIAYDLVPRVTEIVLDEMHLENVVLRETLNDSDVDFDAVVALDVFEHVSNLEEIYDDLLARTTTGGSWVISGPTENFAYRLARKIAGTSGEGHVRTVYEVFHAVPNAMSLSNSVRLPFGSPWPLFVVGIFEKT